eukprot:365337-Chlamydomonas_euryale.AAC.4
MRSLLCRPTHPQTLIVLLGPSAPHWPPAKCCAECCPPTSPRPHSIFPHLLTCLLGQTFPCPSPGLSSRGWAKPSSGSLLGCPPVAGPNLPLPLSRAVLQFLGQTFPCPSPELSSRCWAKVSPAPLPGCPPGAERRLSMGGTAAAD